ncbi:MAG: metal-dependent hydrolase [Flavobacteriales bacterium]|nr:MAG: metal-dependent hydrolase [Flavobacteriales bacterium]
MTIQFLGQNCFLFTYKGKTILTDPFYNFGKEKSGFDISKNKIDYILITHAHGDHTADVKEVLTHYPEAIVIGQPEICGYFGHDKNIDLNFGGSTMIEDLKVSMVPALHTSSFPDGTYGGQSAGYMLNLNGKNIYFAGDTGITAEMAHFQPLYGDIDLAVLPIGGHYTMDAQQASWVSKNWLRTNKVMACHFDTFPPISIDHDKAKNEFVKNNIDLILPEVGEVFEY